MAHEVVVKNLIKRYKDIVAVNNLSINIEDGEIFGLLGPNGSGKTTLINSILSILKYDNGEVFIFGEEMSPKRRDVKQKIGLVPQHVAVYEGLNVQENIDYFCSLYVKDKKERKKLVDEAIDFVQLGDFRKFKPSELSGGLLRRLNLACGIAHKPKLIILDEPTVAVDPQSRNNILEGIKKLNEEGSTIIYTTHYMEEVEYLADRIAILDKGQVLVEGTMHDILDMSSVGERIQLTIHDLDEEVLKELGDKEYVINLSYSNSELQMQMKGSDHLLEMLKFFENKNIDVLDVESKSPSLNDVFLELTGKELRDHA